VIEGARFAPSDIWGAAAALSNPGFEQGLAGWSGQGSIVVGDAHGGANALLIDGLAAGAEQQVYSEMIAVRPDADYALGAWVKVLSDRTGYKVTINWLDAAGRHIRYDNDWKGDDRPTQWSLHGGVFRSPKNAARAQLILGARPGVRILMDDITFAPK
jgi:hypothetical protein